MAGYTQGRVMTRGEFTERYRFELLGIVADASINKLTGAPLAFFLSESSKRINQILGEAFDELRKVQPSNGKPSQSQPARTT